MSKNKKRILLSLLFSIPFLAFAGHKIFYSVKNAIWVEFADICFAQNESLVAFNKGATKVDVLRHCVHKNSWYRIDEEYYEYAKNGSRGFAQALLKQIKNPSDRPPSFECSRRSDFLYRTLVALGYDAETIIVIKKDDNFPDHVVVRVKDKKTGKYEIHDSTADIYFKSVLSGQRIDIVDILKLPPDAFVPCNDNRCGWDIKGQDGQAASKDYYNLSYMGRKYMMRESDIGPLIYNSEHFDPYKDKYMNDNKMLSYCEKFPHRCEKTVDVTKKSIGDR